MKTVLALLLALAVSPLPRRSCCSACMSQSASVFCYLWNLSCSPRTSTSSAAAVVPASNEFCVGALLVASPD